MEALAWHFFVSSLFALLAKNTCQVAPGHNTRTLNPILLLPAPSGISYEALQYPVPVDQYQLIPLVINTGKIPLINHPIQAPIQYFVPNGENQRVTSDVTERHSTAPTRDVHRSTTQRDPKPAFSNAARTENQPAYSKYYPSATMYSETHVEGQPASRYSYGYKIIDGNSNGKHESRGNGKVSGSNGLTKPDKSRIVPEHSASLGDGSRAAATVGGPRNPADKPDKQDESSSSRTLKPIVVKPNQKTAKTELKKRYKNVRNATKLETPINAANEDGILTTLKPQ